MKSKLGIVIALMTLSTLLLAACNPAPTAGQATLEGTPWKLASYVDAAGDPVDILPGSEVTALFAEGRVAGSGGCNRYMGTYTASGQKLTVEVGGSTMMYCSPEELSTQETDYLAALNRAATHKIADDQLQITAEGGEVLLTYLVLEPKPLVGPTWGLTSYNNGKGALSSPLAGSDITAVFSADGNMSGSAGCNSYSAPYDVDGSKISIGPAVSTRMACAEPEGIMEQEMTFLAAVETATEYAIEGDELVLLNDEGVKSAVFAARSEASALALELLANAEYKTEWTPEGVVRLQDGEYRAPAAPGSSSEIVISMTEYVAVGQLKDLATGNTEPGAAVILTSSGGGSGTI